MQVVDSSAAADLVSGQVVDGLFRCALARRMTPALRARLAAAGLDVEARSVESVRRQDFSGWLKLTVESLFSGVSAADAYRQLGRDLVRGYSMTLKGGAVIAVSRVIGPRRTLERIARSISSAVSSYRAKLDVENETAFKLWVSEHELPPSFLAGVLLEAVTLAGAPGVRAEPVRADGGGWIYEVQLS